MSESMTCPFCDGAAEIYKSPRAERWFVMCEGMNDCVAAPEVGGYATRDAAIAAWNRRAPLPSIPHNGTINATEKANA